MFISTSLDYAKFYELCDPLDTKPLRLSDAPYSTWLTIEQAKHLFTGQLRLSEPLKLKAYQGSSPRDFLWAGLSRIISISQRTAELLAENQITGWATYPLIVLGRKGEEIPGYVGFSVTGSSLSSDRSRSEIVVKPPPTPDGQSYRVYRGLYFKESLWDGCDIFLVRGNIVVTEKVNLLFRKAKISNVQLTPLPEVEIDVFLDKFDND